jgi:hypothetical protein
MLHMLVWDAVLDLLSGRTCPFEEKLFSFDERVRARAQGAEGEFVTGNSTRTRTLTSFKL